MCLVIYVPFSSTPPGGGRLLGVIGAPGGLVCMLLRSSFH